MIFFFISVAITIFFISLVVHVTLQRKKIRKHRAIEMLICAVGCVVVSVPYVVYVIFFSGASLLDPVLTTALINALAVIILFLSSMMAAESAERAFAFEIFLSSIIVVFSFIIFDDMSLAGGGAFVFVLATLHFLGRVGANMIIMTRKYSM